jgi:hypothetical protein
MAGWRAPRRCIGRRGGLGCEEATMSNECEGLGLAIDCLDSDRLRGLGLNDLADRLERTVKEIGTLRQLAGLSERADEEE